MFVIPTMLYLLGCTSVLVAEENAYVVSTRIRVPATLALDPSEAYELKASLVVDGRTVSELVYDYDTSLVGAWPLRLEFSVTRRPSKGQKTRVFVRLVKAGSDRTIIGGSAVVSQEHISGPLAIDLAPLPKSSRNIEEEENRAAEQRRRQDEEREARVKAERQEREEKAKRERWCTVDGPAVCKSQGTGWRWNKRRCECYCDGYLDAQGTCKHIPDKY